MRNGKKFKVLRLAPNRKGTLSKATDKSLLLQGKFLNMLTIERQVSQIEELTERLQPDIKRKTESNTSNVSFENLIKELTIVFNKISDDVERNWDRYTSPGRLSNTKNLLVKLREVKDSLHQLDNEYNDIKKELSFFENSVERMITVVSDALEFVNIVDEVNELRSTRPTEDKVKMISDILCRSKLKALEEKGLSDEEIKSDIKLTWENMKNFMSKTTTDDHKNQRCN